MARIKRHRIAALGFLVVLVAALAFAQYAHVVRDNQLFLGTVEMDGAVNVDGATDFDSTVNIDGALTATSTAGVTGAATMSSTLAVTGAATFASTVTSTGTITGVGTISGEQITSTDDASIAGDLTLGDGLIMTGSAVTVASNTFSAANRGKCILNASTNQTTISITGGTLDEEIVLRTGTGSETFLFVDGSSSMSLGANVTMTESQNDVLKLICVSADGDEWAKSGGNDN